MCVQIQKQKQYPENTYLFKCNHKNTGNKCEICSMLTIKAPERIL